MIIKGLIDEDFSNYKKSSMLISFPRCTFKCDKESGEQVCQNSALALSKDIDVPMDTIVRRYMDNNLTSAIVYGGLEPFDSFDDLIALTSEFRQNTDDDIVIYTGYNREEIVDKIDMLKQFKNIIVKFGRFIPYNEKHYDELLGIWLASENQYSERIS